MSETAVKKQSLTVQTAWILAAKIISYALTIAVPLILARRLDQTEFGLYKQVFLIVITANSLLPFSFGMSAYYFLPRESGARRRAAVANILLFHLAAGLFAFLLLFFYPGVLTLIFREAAMTAFAPLIGVAILFWVFSAFLETLVIANQEPRLAMIFSVAAQMTKAIFLVSAAVFAGSIESLVWAAIAQAALQSIVLLVYANLRFGGFWRAFDFRLFGEQFGYTLPFGLGGWLYTAQTDLHNYFVTSRFSAAEYAVYAVGCFELPLIGILAESVSAVLIPAVSRLQASGDKREIIETSARVARKLALAYFPLYAFLVITADVFIVTLFTDKFAASVPNFRLNLTLLPFAIFVLDPIARAYKTVGYYLLKLRVVLFFLMTASLWYATDAGNLLMINAVVVSCALVERFWSTGKIMRTINFRRADWRLFAPLLRTAAATALAAFALLAFYVLTWHRLPAVLIETIEPMLARFGAIFALKAAAFAGNMVYLALCAATFTLIYLALANFFNVIEPSEKAQLVNLVKKRFARNSQSSNETVSVQPS